MLFPIFHLSVSNSVYSLKFTGINPATCVKRLVMSSILLKSLNENKKLSSSNDAFTSCGVIKLPSNMSSSIL